MEQGLWCEPRGSPLSDKSSGQEGLELSVCLSAVKSVGIRQRSKAACFALAMNNGRIIVSPLLHRRGQQLSFRHAVASREESASCVSGFRMALQPRCSEIALFLSLFGSPQQFPRTNRKSLFPLSSSSSSLSLSLIIVLSFLVIVVILVVIIIVCILVVMVVARRGPASFPGRGNTPHSGT